jgi:putative flippase GtrA
MLDWLPAPMRRLALYAMCGGLGATLDTLVFWALNNSGVWYQAANIIGYAAGTLLSFILNRAITFRIYDAPLRRLATFFGVAGVGFLSSAATLWLLIEHLGVPALTSKLLSLVVVVAVQFTLNSLITFRPAATPSDSP